MPTDPESQKPLIKKRPRAKPGPEDFVIFEVDGFAQLTPEQKLWPVVDIFSSNPKAEDPPKE